MQHSETGNARALLRLPGQNLRSFCGDLSAPSRQLPEFRNRETFVYAPFRDGEAPYWLLEETTDTATSQNEIDRWEKQLTGSEKFDSTSRKTYDQNALKLLELLKDGELKKAILSRQLVVEKPAGFSAVSCFNKLCETYPDAAIHLFALENQEIWIGASPECLLQYRHPKLKTVSLAGTRPAGTKSEWGEKEREEQALVTQFISEILENEGLSEIELTGPETARAGKVEHLKTRFNAKTTVNLRWENIIRRLHPTPAIAGYPKEQALQAIEQCEAHQRLYYGGYFGTAQTNSAELFLNLRCMRIGHRNLQLFLGGGYTQASNVQDEWMETEHKATTLLSVIENLQNFDPS